MDRYNTFWRRLVAAIIDSFILWPLTFVNGYLEDTASRIVFSAGSLIFSTLYSTYFIILHAKYGQTVGKKIMQIKVVDINEVSTIGIKRAIMRELPWIVSVIGIFIYSITLLFLTNHYNLENVKSTYNNLLFIISFTWMLIELITMLTNYKRRAVHDYLAKSVVIKTDS